MITLRRTRSRWVIAMMTLIGIAFLVRQRILKAAGAALVENDGVTRMQAAVVLGGDYYCSRILTAASLARAGNVPFVIVSGPGAFGGHESDYTIRYAGEQGYPASLFQAYPNDSTSTASEVKDIGTYLRANRISCILLITSNYHTRRAARTFRALNPGITVRVVPAPDPAFTPDGWWTNREGRKTFLLEWSKTVASWVGA